MWFAKLVSWVQSIGKAPVTPVVVDTVKQDTAVVVEKQIESDLPEVIDYKFEFNDDEVDLVPPAQPDAEQHADAVVNQTNLPWMDSGFAKLGLREDKDEEEIVGWAKDVGVEDSYSDSDIPWCGLFEGKIQVDAQCKIPDEPLWALDWNKFGFKLTEPAYGATLVFKRNGGGHVGNYISEEEDYFHVLGGNQGNKVCIKKIAKANLVGIRWPNEYKDRLKKGRIFAQLDEEIISSSQMA